MKHPLRRFLISFLLCLSFGFAPGVGAQTAPRVEQFKLDNGLTLIVKPDRRAPTMSVRPL